MRLRFRSLGRSFPQGGRFRAMANSVQQQFPTNHQTQITVGKRTWTILFRVRSDFVVGRLCVAQASVSIRAVDTDGSSADHFKSVCRLDAQDQNASPASVVSNSSSSASSAQAKSFKLAGSGVEHVSKQANAAST